MVIEYVFGEILQALGLEGLGLNSSSQLTAVGVNSLFFFFFLINVIGVDVTYQVVLVSGVQQSESAMHIPVYPFFFQILSTYRLSQSIRFPWAI